MAKFIDVFEDVTKLGTKIPTNLYLDSGLYPIIDQGQSEIAGYTNEEKGLFIDVPAIVFGDHTRVIKYIDNPCFLGADGVKLLKAKDKSANYKYLYYALCNADIPNTGYNRHFKWLKEIEIPDYLTEEQVEIVAQLERVDSVISLRKQQLSKLDELVKSRFVELFGGEKYAKKPIRELVDRKIASARKTYGCDDTIHYIDISSIDNKANVVTGTTEYIMADAPSRAQQCIQYGDILISTVRPNLRNIARNEYSGDKYVASSGFCVLRAKNCDTRFLLCAVLADDFTNAMTEVTTGANYPAIKDSDVLGYRIPAPPIELQKQFAAFVEQTDKSKFEIQKSLNQLETLKKALMQKYFG